MLKPSRMPIDRRDERGPFDIVGDVHGCFDELRQLLTKLGWTILWERGGQRVEPRVRLSHGEDRKLVFVGDLAARGPHPEEVLALAFDALETGQALCVPGNRDLPAPAVSEETSVSDDTGARAERAASDEPLDRRTAERVAGLPSHLVLDQGRLIVAHAGLPEALHGQDSEAARTFAIYGEKRTPDNELRNRWARGYQGRAIVIHGHTPVREPRWLNRTLGIDTGCVYGGALTALRYPELELVSVAAGKTYYARPRPW